MEKLARMRKTGPIPCKSTPKVESIADFYSHHEEGSDSGMEIIGMARFPPHKGTKSFQRPNTEAEQSPDEGQSQKARRIVGWYEEEREGEHISGRERV